MRAKFQVFVALPLHMTVQIANIRAGGNAATEVRAGVGQDSTTRKRKGVTTVDGGPTS